ncbi:hypothetical protein BCR35DRAFT_335813 [Leucosporidium creatinivorum]|uniref:Uncharacterized protein n=1 Tax=Leucosporidium creatinivorum TaxID=106004 RepID=A0A1Y2D4U1_9BASI|nr:hypothetical protein BCR35DRAFT_335813 [Leucosporidium creatinivorum]
MAHSFFSDPFAHLHDDVFAFLAASPTIHAVLPLLGVNRYWRKLTIRKLVKEFSRTQVKDVYFNGLGGVEPLLSKGSYLKVHLSNNCQQDGMRKTNDRRFRPFHHALHLPTPDWHDDLFPHEALILQGIDYDFPVRDDGEDERYVWTGAWRPERFPIMGSAGAGFFPEVAGPKEVEKGNPRVTVREKEIRNGWKLSWHTHRIEHELPTGTGLHGDRRAQVVLAVHQIEAPLIDLFCPRKTASKEMWEKGGYG